MRPPPAVVCAWCGRVLVEGRWGATASDVEAHAQRTHGICPACFTLLAPGVRYPPD